MRSADGGRPLISVIMPVYNGSSYIGESIRRVTSYMEELGVPYEVIVVDDGSEDGTRTKALKHVSSRVRVLGYDHNRGKGYAFIHGALRSRGDIIVLLDSDLDVPPQQVSTLLQAINSGADIVITNKWHPQSRTIATPTRRFLSLSYNALVRLLTGLKLQDTQTGAKAFRREPLLQVIKHMHVKRYAFDTELLLIAKQLGYKMVEIPNLKPILLTSRFKLKEIMRMLLELLSITYRHRMSRTARRVERH